MLKKITLSLMSALAVLLNVHAARAEQNINPMFENKKILTVSFSYSGNTRELARRIHDIVGGDWVELEPVEPYPEAYQDILDLAQKEKEEGIRPALKTKIDNLADYDIVFVGSPVWWYSITPPIRTFLAENDLSGKTVVPFCTHGSGGEAESFKEIQKIAPQAKVLEGFSIAGSRVQKAQKKIEEWLGRLKK